MKEKSGFSIYTHWISNLGDTRTRSHTSFDIIALIYSIFNVLFTNKIQSTISNNFLATICIALLYAFSLLIILIIVFPMNKNFKVHRIVSDLLFISILTALILLFLQIKTSIILQLLLLTTIAFGFTFITTFINMKLKYKKVPKTLVGFRKKEKSIFIRNICVLEWISLSLIIFYQILVVLS